MAIEEQVSHLHLRHRRPGVFRQSSLWSVYPAFRELGNALISMISNAVLDGSMRKLTMVLFLLSMCVVLSFLVVLIHAFSAGI